MTTLYEGAFAKLNLTLDVLDKRPDGYHNLKSVMQTISIRDDIEIVVRGKFTEHKKGRRARVEHHRIVWANEGCNLLGDRNLFLLIGFKALIEVHAVIGLIRADGTAVYTGEKPFFLHILKVGSHRDLRYVKEL